MVIYPKKLHYGLKTLIPSFFILFNIFNIAIFEVFTLLNAHCDNVMSKISFLLLLICIYVISINCILSILPKMLLPTIRVLCFRVSSYFANNMYGFFTIKFLWCSHFIINLVSQ